MAHFFQAYAQKLEMKNKKIVENRMKMEESIYDKPQILITTFGSQLVP